MPEPTDVTISAWLSPATVAFTPEDLSSYRDVIAYAFTKITTSNSHQLVAVAHGIGRPAEREWLTTLVRAKKDNFVAVNNDELLSRVACCITLRSLATDSGHAPLVGLLVQSALFIGATSPIGELTNQANAAVASAAISARQRPAVWSPITTEFADLLSAEPAASPDHLLKAIPRLAEAIDALGARVDERAKILDEEYGALWWSYSGRSVTTGEPWDNIKPIGRRVVLAANELGQQITNHPGPPMVRGLLAAALQDQADRMISLGEVALEAADAHVSVAPKAKNPLLPISSAVLQITELGRDGNTWKEVLDKSLGLKDASTTTALDAALQLFREVEIGKFLE